jgi:TDG/mug DNA glycosylase family protein
MSISTSFPPIASPGARILILGSLPGVTSLKQHQYYAHPQNAFWKIMETLFEIPRHAPYAERCERLQLLKLALWDVCHSASRPGSLDSAIVAESVIANDIPGLLKRIPSIECIAFNGQAAAKLFQKHIDLKAMPTLLLLPSTSPAHASQRFEQKLAQWQALQLKLSRPTSLLHAAASPQ